MDLDPDLQTRMGGSLAARHERFADLLERFFDGNALGKPVGSDFHAPTAEVGDELDELLASFDVLLDDRRLRRLKLADSSAAPDLHAGLREALANLLTL